MIIIKEYKENHFYHTTEFNKYLIFKDLKSAKNFINELNKSKSDKVFEFHKNELIRIITYGYTGYLYIIENEVCEDFTNYK